MTALTKNKLWRELETKTRFYLSFITIVFDSNINSSALKLALSISMMGTRDDVEVAPNVNGGTKYKKYLKKRVPLIIRYIWIQKNRRLI